MAFTSMPFHTSKSLLLTSLLQAEMHSDSTVWSHLRVLCTVVPPRTIRTPPGVDLFNMWTIRASSYVTPPTTNTITSCGLQYHQQHQ